MENTKEVNLVSERETFLHRAEQPDLSQMNVEQAYETTVDQTIVKLDTSSYNPMIHTNVNNADIYLDRKELKDNPLYICENEIVKKNRKGINGPVEDDGAYNKETPIVPAENRMTSKIKRQPARKNKKNSQQAGDKKENLRKISSASKPKTSAKRSTKTSSKTLSANQLLKQEVKESMKKLGMYKISTEGCIKCTLLPCTSVQSETKTTHDTQISRSGVTRWQEFNQYENNMNVLQHLDCNSLKYVNQQTMPVTNSWATAPKDENFALNNSVNNTQTEVEQSSYVNDKQYAYAAAVNYSCRQNGNPHFNPLINFPMDPYKILPEHRAYYPCCIYGSNYMWNNYRTESFPRTNTTFQHAANNIAHNYVLPANSSTNLLNPAATPFNPFYYCHQPPPPMDDNFNKLYYKNHNNNGCELTVKKENVMPMLDNWHHASPSMIPSNGILNVPSAISTPTTCSTMWYNSSPSSSVDASTSAISNAGKMQSKCEQSTYFGDYNTQDATNASMHKDQWQEKSNFIPYARPNSKNTLPGIDTLRPGLYKTDNELTTGIFSQQNAENRNTVTSIDNSMMSDVANNPSETSALDVSQDVRTPTIYTDNSKKMLMAEVLESIL